MRVGGVILMIFGLLWHLPLYAGIGDIDSRVYVDWSQPPYNKIVYFYPSQYATCTAQYVAPDIILTARHCVTDNISFDNYREQGKTFEIWTHDDRRTRVQLEEYGRNIATDDWALLRVTDSNFFRDDYFDVADKSGARAIETAGFAGLRILSNAEIQQIKEIFVRVIREKKLPAQNYEAIMRYALQDIYDSGIADLYDSRARGDKPGQWEFKLKANKSCKISGTRNKGTFFSTCDTDHGDSGGPYFSGTTLYGIVSGGRSGFDDSVKIDFGVKNERFYKTLNKMKKSSGVKASAPPVEDNDGDAAHVMADVEQQLDAIDEKLKQRALLVDKMTDKDFFDLLQQSVEYRQLRENYERAKQREQSLSNRVLSAAAIGAGGIGGMMLASGMAEVHADAQAEMDMKAYLSTFRCDYGAGRNIHGGDQQIELPGAAALMGLRTEYLKLATDLKTRKESLEMAPGIESEHIEGNATIGLYDDVSLGKTDGGFTSLSRALFDKNSADAAAWNAQKTDAKQKAETGGIVGGGGLLGGSVGNVIVNQEDD